MKKLLCCIKDRSWLLILSGLVVSNTPLLTSSLVFRLAAPLPGGPHIVWTHRSCEGDSGNTSQRNAESVCGIQKGRDLKSSAFEGNTPPAAHV